MPNKVIKSIVFLGSKSIGYECLKYLYNQQNKLAVKLVGVLTNARGKKIVEFCENKSLRIIKDLNEFLKIGSCDIAISVQYHEILKKQQIAIANEIFVNLHMAPLPEYRGSNQFSFAIINSDSRFGTTIHRLEEGVDNGAILFEKRFSIPEHCWVEQLYDITYKNSVNLFQKSLPKLISGNYQLRPQESFIDRKSSFHYRNEIDELKKIDLAWNEEKIMRYIRATYMPGFEPPYTFINEQKYFFKKG